MRNKGIGEVIDIYTLRRSFNETTKAKDYDHPEFVSAFVTAAQEFDNLLTHYYHEYGKKFDYNRDVVTKAETRLKAMADIAFALGAEAMVLAVPAESPDADLVGEMVRNREDKLPVRVLLQVR